jgi:hypothetical protein
MGLLLGSDVVKTTPGPILFASRLAGVQLHGDAAPR